MALKLAETRTSRIELSDGDWIEVKDQLTYGEAQRLTYSGYRNGENGFEPDLASQAIQRIMTWVTDWSLLDAEGRPTEVRRDLVEGLDQTSAAAIDAALTKHIMEVQKNQGNGSTPRTKRGSTSGNG